MPTESPLPKDHPALVAWEQYKQTEEFANTRKWARYEEHIDGSLWAAFYEGYSQLEAQVAQQAEAYKALELQFAIGDGCQADKIRELTAERDTLRKRLSDVEIECGRLAGKCGQLKRQSIPYRVVEIARDAVSTAKCLAITHCHNATLAAMEAHEKSLAVLVPQESTDGRRDSH